jgi:hypothetical protein
MTRQPAAPDGVPGVAAPADGTAHAATARSPDASIAGTGSGTRRVRLGSASLAINMLATGHSLRT